MKGRTNFTGIVLSQPCWCWPLCALLDIADKLVVEVLITMGERGLRGVQKGEEVVAVVESDPGDWPSKGANGLSLDRLAWWWYVSSGDGADKPGGGVVHAVGKPLS